MSITILRVLRYTGPFLNGFVKMKIQIVHVISEVVIECDIGKNKLPAVKSYKYLGVMLNDKNDGNKKVINKFNHVRKCSFSLSSLV